MWSWIVDRVMRHPVVSVVVAGGLLVALAIPAFSLHTVNPGLQGLPKGLPITIWHSEDDEFISADNTRRYAEKLPSAEVHFLDGYGHQFTKSLTFLADAIRGDGTTVWGLAWSPNGSALVSAGSDGALRIYGLPG